jgi:hypothetical protein
MLLLVGVVMGCCRVIEVETARGMKMESPESWIGCVFAAVEFAEIP